MEVPAVRRRSSALLWLLALPALAGCATAFGEGVAAARAGRYIDAAAYFERALIDDPDRLEALVGLAVTRYRLGAFDEAVESLERARARAPRDADVQLYLGLSHLQTGRLGPADEHLTLYVELAPDRRIAAQTQRALRLLRGDPLDAEMRAFVATSLDQGAELARELQETQRALAAAEARPRLRLGPACVLRSGRLHCF